MQYSFCNGGPALFWFIFYETQWPLMVSGVTWGGGGVSFVELGFSDNSHRLVSWPLVSEIIFAGQTVGGDFNC